MTRRNGTLSPPPAAAAGGDAVAELDRGMQPMRTTELAAYLATSRDRDATGIVAPEIISAALGIGAADQADADRWSARGEVILAEFEPGGGWLLGLRLARDAADVETAAARMDRLATTFLCRAARLRKHAAAMRADALADLGAHLERATIGLPPGLWWGGCANSAEHTERATAKGWARWQKVRRGIVAARERESRGKRNGQAHKRAGGGRHQRRVK